VIMAGHFAGTANFGGANLPSAGVFDAFLARYTSAGTHVWSQRFGGISNEFCYTVDINATGDIAIAGSFAQSADFGGGVFVSNGSSDTFVARYDAAGVHEWSRSAGGALPDNAGALVFGADGDLVVTGYFQDVADFGGGDMGSAGLTDAFFARYSASAPEPAITSIADIGNDQGRKVRIRFDRSGVDDEDAAVPVTRYVAFRRDDPPPAGVLAPPTPDARETLAAGWTEVGSVLAFAEESYGIDVATIGDSTIAQGQYYSVFYVRAATDVPSRFWDSSPDSGYSVDNLAPGVPANLALAAGQLTWDESTAADFDYFTVYGANVDDFGAATVVDYTVTPAMDVTSSPYAFYFVTATDFSGNEGNPAQVGTLTDVGETPRRYVLSISAYPNPFNPATTIRYTLPSRGRVVVTVYDARGMRIASLVDAERSAGAYTARWDGTDHAGSRVSSGVYFARIAHNGATRTQKLVLLK
ncbi:MAG TPA: T9SS type A sorting domain-containing protein, partial [Candidatus Krumholzibacteria bacterium]|nr:T9SS type A sorting domain-containing protein [Candidatus Krumholzibacteria bacterium]